MKAQRVSRDGATDIATEGNRTSAAWLGIAALALLVAAVPAEAKQKQKKAPADEPIAEIDNSEPMTLVVSVGAQKVDIYRGTQLLTTPAVSTGHAGTSHDDRRLQHHREAAVAPFQHL